MITQSDFTFSAVDVDDLTSSEYTLVTLALDMSSSVYDYEKDLKKCIETIIDTCHNSSRAENLMLRLTTFNNNLYEEHGFKTLGIIKPEDYKQIRSPSGMTALYDACIDAIESTEQYGKALTEQEFEVNGVLYVITDGGDNKSKYSMKDVADKLKLFKHTESLESLQTFLIGVNVQEPYFKQYLEDFNTTAGFDEFLSIENASTETLSKLANFISKSISLQSQSLGTGSFSNALPSF
jgi:uncharacterized protein YegL